MLEKAMKLVEEAKQMKNVYDAINFDFHSVGEIKGVDQEDYNVLNNIAYTYSTFLKGAVANREFPINQVDTINAKLAGIMLFNRSDLALDNYQPDDFEFVFNKLGDATREYHDFKLVSMGPGVNDEKVAIMDLNDEENLDRLGRVIFTVDESPGQQKLTNSWYGAERSLDTYFNFVEYAKDMLNVYVDYVYYQYDGRLYFLYV